MVQYTEHEINLALEAIGNGQSVKKAAYDQDFMAASEGQQPLLTYRGSLYNMDETGILKGKRSNGLALGRAKTKSVQKKQPGSQA
ncbi:transposase [Colletotrichum incanum]|uniref:Transposase n=1 Tax=Colletotrichum incanum TaxID=1573173 RepID=A0A166RPJ9_COLIC|nr:transposase [Colletotrichum incanum]